MISLSSETVEAEIEESNLVITHVRREIEKLQFTVSINKELIIEALNNFNNLFKETTNEEIRALLRALIKEIRMKADRNSIKNIVFWFTEDDYFMKSAIPVSDVMGAVSQVVVKQKVALRVEAWMLIIHMGA